MKPLALFRAWLLVGAGFLGPVMPAHAQFVPFNVNNPQPILASLIAAFQNCGPMQTYLLLGQLLYQSVYNQTGGMGCYPQVRAYGPVQSMHVLNRVTYPAGPIYTIRSDHPAGSLYWQIGLSTWTNRVEYLMSGTQDPGKPPEPQSVSLSDIPSHKKKEIDEKSQKGPVDTEKPADPIDPQLSCIVYRNMCPRNTEEK
jgi:hypothetical protein